MTDFKINKKVNLGYCTNVHAGLTYQEIQNNLQRHSVGVKELVSPHDPMGIGLWLPASAAKEILQKNLAPEFNTWLKERGLYVFTFNGFPYGDFHQHHVKYHVYEPNWSDPKRLEYSWDLIQIFLSLLPENGEGSISTLPLGWKSGQDDALLQEAAKQLSAMAQRLKKVEEETGKLIHLSIEPEPGCTLTTNDDVITFFNQYLFKNGESETLRRYIRVCYDICHASVMFEEQEKTLQKFLANGIQLGKVQISSALSVPFHQMDAPQRQEVLLQLLSFAEDRYLHQTTMRQGNRTILFDDLPTALKEAEKNNLLFQQEWRIHFHVPLFVEKYGLLCSTQKETSRFLQKALPHCSDFEVETYTWGVLPQTNSHMPLCQSIAQELTWARQQLEHTTE